MEFDETQLFLLKGALLFFILLLILISIVPAYIEKRKKLKSKRLKQSFNEMKLNGKDLHENINVFVRKFDKKITDKRYFPDNISYIFFRMEKDDSIKDDIKLKWDETHIEYFFRKYYTYVFYNNLSIDIIKKLNAYYAYVSKRDLDQLNCRAASTFTEKRLKELENSVKMSNQVVGISSKYIQKFNNSIKNSKKQ